MTEPILTLSIDQIGVQALANLLRTIAEDYPLGIAEGTAGGIEIYPHGVGSRRAPFELEEPIGEPPVLAIPPGPFRCAVDGCGRAFPTRFGAEVHQRRMHKPTPAIDPVDPVDPARPVAQPDPSRAALNGRVKNHAQAVDLLEAPALPVSSYCRRGDCHGCKTAQARCGHDCHPNSRQVPPDPPMGTMAP